MEKEASPLSERTDICQGPLAKKIDEYLTRSVPFGFSGTVLVTHESKNFLKKGYGLADYENNVKMEFSSVLSVGSISKQFTATAIMKLVDEGAISLDDRLHDIWSFCPKDKQGISIQQMLNHTSGLPMMHGDDFEEIPREQFINGVFERALNSEPGQTFHYSNVGYSLLGMIIEEKTGEDYTDYMKRYLFRPLGMENTGWFGNNIWDEKSTVTYYSDGEERGSVKTLPGPYWPILANGGVCTNLDDLYTWISALMTGEIISQDSLNKMLTPRMNNYGFGWDIIDHPYLGRQITHDGGSDIGVSAEAHWFPESETMFLILSNVSYAGKGFAFVVNRAVLDLIAGQEAYCPPKVDTTPEYMLSQGTYHSENGFLKIIMKHHLMLCQPFGQDMIDLFFGIEEEFHSYNDSGLHIGQDIIRGDTVRLEGILKKPKRAAVYVKMFKEWVEHMSRDCDKIVGVRVVGTYPDRNNSYNTHLQFFGEKGMSGLQVVWDGEKVLGFRTVFRPFPASFVISVKNGKMIAFNFETGTIVSLSYELPNGGIRITNDSKMTLTAE